MFKTAKQKYKESKWHKGKRVRCVPSCLLFVFVFVHPKSITINYIRLVSEYRRKMLLCFYSFFFLSLLSLLIERMPAVGANVP